MVKSGPTGYTQATMRKNISVTIDPEQEGDERIIRKKAAETLNVRESEITALEFRKKSIDARRGRVKLCLSYVAWIGESPSDAKAFEPAWKKADPNKRVVVVGSGPAGLFAALRLLEYGITPIVVERGKETSARKRDIARISREQRVDPESNYCFGEGGAGTFSDGKLYTRSNKRGNIGHVLAIFNHHGADASILTDAQPHIGSDRLPAIINAMRETVTSNGGTILFNAKCVGFETKGNRVVATRVARTGGPSAEETIESAAVILATGHSARDVYEELARLESAGATGGTPILEAKTFAVGVRVEHPRTFIDRAQYHGKERGASLPAATYRLTAQIDGRGVYSFCMCPGGLIVPSATAEDEIVVNGMSPSDRNSRWSNAAVVVETHPDDVPARFAEGGAKELSSLRYQQWLEREAKRHGDGQRAPAQRLADFVEGRDSADLPECSYAPGVTPSRLDQWLPKPLGDRLRAGFAEFNKFLRDFVSNDAIVVGVETRTSSPVRILRDEKTLECVGLHGLFPAGEGSGYAGGIVSSAMDGERCADSVASEAFGFSLSEKVPGLDK